MYSWGKHFNVAILVCKTCFTNGYYFFFPAFAKLFFTLNFIILDIKVKGIGLSKGNCTVLFAPSYAESSFLNASFSLGAGYSPICVFQAPKITKLPLSVKVGMVYLMISSASGAAFLMAGHYRLQMLLNICWKTCNVFIYVSSLPGFGCLCDHLGIDTK